MKNLTRVLLLLILTAGLTSCEKIKNIFDVEIDTLIESDMHINVEEEMTKSSPPYEFDETTVLKVLENEDIYEHQDKIVDFIVSGATAEVMQVDAEGVLDVDDVVFLDSTVFLMYNGVRPDIRWVFMGDWPMIKGTKIDLFDDLYLYSSMGVMFTDFVDITVNAVGYSNKTPVSVTIKLSVTNTIVANVLGD